MRGLSEFQRSQMKHRDARVAELFQHVRRGVEVLEDILLNPFVPPVPADDTKTAEQRAVPKMAIPVFEQSKIAPKAAYSVKDIRNLFGIGTTTIYAAMKAGKLRVVKSGNKTLILAADLQQWIDSWPER